MNDQYTKNSNMRDKTTSSPTEGITQPLVNINLNY